MKMRIRGNSLRLRLGPTEVQRLANGGCVQETITFGPVTEQTLRYVIESSAVATAIVATFHANCIRVLLPLSIAQRWAQGHDVGIETEQVTGADSMLTLLIEKDFKCLDRSAGEEQTDVYPNPKHGSDCAADL